MKGPVRYRTAIVALLLAPLLGYAIAYLAGITSEQNSQQPLPESLRGVVLEKPVPLKPFALVDGDGQRLRPKSLEGRWTFVMFGYTHCPDVCPFTLTNLARLRTIMAQRRSAFELPEFLFVSVDPARDRPAELNHFVRYFDPAFKAATGPREQLDALVAQLGAFYRYDRKDEDGAYAVSHSAEVYVLDPTVRLYATLRPPFDPVEIAGRFEALIAHYASTIGASGRHTVARGGP